MGSSHWCAGDPGFAWCLDVQYNPFPSSARATILADKSMYVSLIFGLVALGLIFLNGVLVLFMRDHPNVQADTTLYLAAALVAALATLWCGWHNLRMTRSVSLAASLTVIQTVISGTVIAILFILAWKPAAIATSANPALQCLAAMDASRSSLLSKSVRIVSVIKIKVDLRDVIH